MLIVYYYVSYIPAGLIGQLNSESFSLLSKIQSKMATLIKSVGNISHEVYPLYMHADESICMKRGVEDSITTRTFWWQVMYEQYVIY